MCSRSEDSGEGADGAKDRKVGREESKKCWYSIDWDSGLG